MVNLIHFFCDFLGMGKEVRSKSHLHKMTIHYPKSAVSRYTNEAVPRQQNSTKRWSVWSTANTYIPLYRCNLHFGLLAARGCRRIPRKFPTIQSNRKRARKSTPSLENANCSGCFLIFWDDICTYDFSTRDASCLFLI